MIWPFRSEISFLNAKGSDLLLQRTFQQAAFWSIEASKSAVEVLRTIVAERLVNEIRKRVDDLMNSDSDREVAIFTQALKVAQQARDAFLEVACGGDEELRGKVEALLKAHDRLGRFLEDPPKGLADDWDDAHE